jgi:EAL domain-containing protein (putative c-di-GMP-specific phosphodiesterase class I)
VIGGMPRILAVEDEAPVLRIMERILGRAGHEVIGAPGGAEALRAAEGGDFDVAVVDYQIPGPNGLEVLQRLRDIQPGCVRILASGQLDLPVTMQAVNRGEIARVLEKPYEWDALVSVVRDALATRSRAEARVLAGRDSGDREQRVMLNECLQGDTLSLAMQPIVTAAERRLVAYECLLRSRHPVLKGPLEILHAAERFGKLPDVGLIVAHRAAHWMERVPTGTKLFLNLHPEDLGDPPGLCRRLEPLHRFAARMVLEITERASVLSIPAWEESMAMLAEHGYAIAVDDLGAGYSSLSILAELKPQYIKVDMSIVRDVDSDPHKQRLVDLLCRFADATHAQLIAEGVETEAEAKTVVACGAHFIQGYLIGRPAHELRLVPTTVQAHA